MTRKTAHIVLSSLVLSLATQAVWATPVDRCKVCLHRDATYERNLQWEASADNTVTPAKVIRWIMGMRGRTLAAPSPVEFQPIVNAHDGQSLFVAAIAYKF